MKDALIQLVDDDIRKRAANHFPARQIANAMAGVPDISWRRSLDHCSANPSTIPVDIITDLYFRELYGLPIPGPSVLALAYSPLPRPLPPILAFNSGTKNV